MSGVKGIIGMHRFNICLVVVLSLSCSGVKTPLVWLLHSFLTYLHMTLKNNNKITIGTSVVAVCGGGWVSPASPEVSSG